MRASRVSPPSLSREPWVPIVQGDEAAFDELQAVVVRADAASLGALADAGERLIERHDDGGGTGPCRWG